jgi:ketosteroid isomerase-like protein
MKSPNLFLLVSLVLFLQTAFVLADENAQTDVANKIKAMENELARAVVARDYEALKYLEADTYVYTDSDAKVSTRDDFIKDYRTGRSNISALRFDEMIVTAYGDAAVVRGVLTVSRVDNGVHHSRRSRYTRFYVKFPEGWRAVAGHSSKLNDLTK